MSPLQVQSNAACLYCFDARDPAMRFSRKRKTDAAAIEEMERFVAQEIDLEEMEAFVNGLQLSDEDKRETGQRGQRLLFWSFGCLDSDPADIIDSDSRESLNARVTDKNGDLDYAQRRSAADFHRYCSIEVDRKRTKVYSSLFSRSSHDEYTDRVSRKSLMRLDSGGPQPIKRASSLDSTLGIRQQLWYKTLFQEELQFATKARISENGIEGIQHVPIRAIDWA